MPPLLAPVLSQPTASAEPSGSVPRSAAHSTNTTSTTTPDNPPFIFVAQTGSQLSGELQRFFGPVRPMPPGTLNPEMKEAARKMQDFLDGPLSAKKKKNPFQQATAAPSAGAPSASKQPAGMQSAAPKTDGSGVPAGSGCSCGRSIVLEKGKPISIVNLCMSDDN
jgi:hypothetical protein